MLELSTQLHVMYFNNHNILYNNHNNDTINCPVVGQNNIRKRDILFSCF